jgi:predicted nucleic acid-binding protein
MEGFLIDTNIFLEILLGQERKEKCKIYLNQRLGKIYISDFSLHSIGVILFKLEKQNKFDLFLDDILPRIETLGLPLIDYKKVRKISSKYKLDFDDAYQTSVAESYGLIITTIDKDFRKIEADYKVEFIN